MKNVIIATRTTTLRVIPTDTATIVEVDNVEDELSGDG
jgi:hypothetical protein